MKKIFTLLLITILTINYCYSQINYITHHVIGGTGNDIGSRMDVTNEGTVLRGGAFEGTASGHNSVGASDALIIRELSSGLSNWNIAHGSTLNDEAKFVKGYKNRVIESGDFNNTVDFNPYLLAIYNLVSNNGKGTYISVYDTSTIPLFQWARKIIPNNVNSRVSINDLTIDKDGAIYVIGNMYGSVFFQTDYLNGQLLTASTYGDIFFAKYDINGVFLWARQIGLNTAPGQKTGSANYRENSGNVIEVDSQKNIYIAGKLAHWDIDLDVHASVVTAWGIGSAGYTGFFMAKYDSNQLYINHFKRPAPDTDIDEIMDMKIKNNSLYITGVYGGYSFQTNFSNTGTFNLTSGGFEGNGFIAKYDTAFNFSWAKAFDNQSASTNYLGREVYGNALEVDDNENVYVGIQYKRNVELNPFGTSSFQTVAGGYDASMAKFSSSGAFLWAAPFATAGNESINSIIVDNTNQIHINGYFSNTLNINPLGTAVNITSAGGTDWLYAKYSQSAPLPLTWLSFIATDKSQFVHLAWETKNEVNTSHFEIERSHNATTWIYFGKIDASSNRQGSYAFDDIDYFTRSIYYRIKQIDIDNKSTYSAVRKINRANNNEFSMYPNPCNSLLTIDFALATENSTIEIFTLDGRLISKQQAKNKTQKLNVESLTKGNYMLRVSSMGKIYTSKFVRQ
jgi:hypothetical protein